MPDAQELTQRAIELAARAVDELVVFAGTVDRHTVDEAVSLAHTGQDQSFECHRRRETWESHSADMLLMALGCLVDEPDGDDEDDEAQAIDRLEYDANIALGRRDLAAVRSAAQVMIRQAERIGPDDQNYGNLIHNGHVLLGWAHVVDGDPAKAGDELRAAGRSPGSPQLDSFGPDLGLAFELLKAGRDAEVLDYLHNVSRFWSPQTPLSADND